MPPDATDSPIFARNVPGMTRALQAAVVGIAGCGGLGSNVAVALTRAGIGRLILVDHDRVDISNLNRQHYFQSDVGRLKVDALADHLRAIHPAVQIEGHAMRLTPDDVPSILAPAEVLIEAFDRAQEKQWLIETWSGVFPKRPIICASGLGGLGNTASLRIRSSGAIHFCGDGTTDMSQGLCAARVGVVANMQANLAIELLVRDGATTDAHDQ